MRLPFYHLRDLGKRPLHGDFPRDFNFASATLLVLPSGAQLPLGSVQFDTTNVPQAPLQGKLSPRYARAGRQRRARRNHGIATVNKSLPARHPRVLRARFCRL